MDEYVIINKTSIQKRIEELENKTYDKTNPIDIVGEVLDRREKIIFNDILSKSCPLIPEIEKTFDVGVLTLGHFVDMEKQNYIADLKLNI